MAVGPSLMIQGVPLAGEKGSQARKRIAPLGKIMAMILSLTHSWATRMLTFGSAATKIKGAGSSNGVEKPGEPGCYNTGKLADAGSNPAPRTKIKGGENGLNA